MIPKVWEFALLALAAFRVTRLLGWDTFPPIEKARARLLGSWIEPVCSNCNVGRADYEESAVGWVGLTDCPNCGSTETATFLEGHRRQTLGALFDCPFCLGWWLSLGFWLAWVVLPYPTLVVAVPLALSGVVGLIAKNLDA